MRELSPFSQNLSMTRILCGSFEKLKKLPQPEKQRSNHFVGKDTLLFLPNNSHGGACTSRTSRLTRGSGEQRISGALTPCRTESGTLGSSESLPRKPEPSDASDSLGNVAMRLGNVGYPLY